MHVVIRVPWKRPKNFVADYEDAKSEHETSGGWTPEKDAQLWKLLASNPPDQVDWDLVAQQMNITAEECFERSTFLYRQQIENIQQQMFKKKRQSLLMNQSVTSVNNNSQLNTIDTSISIHNKSVQATALDSSKNVAPKPQVLPTIPKDTLLQLVSKYDFDWVRIGAELNIDPETCRKVYNYYEKQEFKKQKRQANKIPANNNNNNSRVLYLDPSQLLQSMRPGFSPGPSRPITPHLKALEKIPAFLLTDSTGNVNRSDTSQTSQGEINSENSSTGSFLSNDSISKSALESAYLHMEHSEDSD